MLCLKVIYCFCRVPSTHSIEIQTYDLLYFWLWFLPAPCLFVCLFFGWFWSLLLTTTTLDSPFATSASLTHGFDPRLFYGHSLASDSVTPANLISVYDFGTNKQPRVNSSPGLRLTPVPGITVSELMAVCLCRLLGTGCLRVWVLMMAVLVQCAVHNGLGVRYEIK